MASRLDEATLVKQRRCPMLISQGRIEKRCGEPVTRYFLDDWSQRVRICDEHARWWDEHNRPTYPLDQSLATSGAPRGVPMATETVKHTAGPWTLHDDGTFVYAIDPTLGSNRFWLKVSSGSATQGECEANARLIAAAPELLAALETILSRCDDCVEDPECFDPAHRGARAAIAKATGDQERVRWDALRTD